MAVGVRFTKDERALIRERLTELSSPKQEKLRESILAKLDLSELGLKKKPSGVPAKRAIELFRDVLGKRLVLPPAPDGAWWAVQQRALTSGGFTESDLRTVAGVAASRWRGPVKFESLVRQGAVLLQTADEVADSPANAPLEMETR